MRVSVNSSCGCSCSPHSIQGSSGAKELVIIKHLDTFYDKFRACYISSGLTSTTAHCVISGVRDMTLRMWNTNTVTMRILSSNRPSFNRRGNETQRRKTSGKPSSSTKQHSSLGSTCQPVSTLPYCAWISYQQVRRECIDQPTARARPFLERAGHDKCCPTVHRRTN